MQEIFSISSVDGRYLNETKELRTLMSEYALIKKRIEIEIKWFRHLEKQEGIMQLSWKSNSCERYLDNIINNFGMKDVKKIKKIESRTKHDVKSVEYFLKDLLSKHHKLKKFREFVHFGCTSEDINNLAYGTMLKDTIESLILPYIEKLYEVVDD